MEKILSLNGKSLTKHCLHLKRCNAERREEFPLPFGASFQVIYPPFQPGIFGASFGLYELCEGEFKIDKCSTNIKTMEVRCNAQCNVTLSRSDLSFHLGGNCARYHTISISVEIDIGPEITIPYFLRLDKTMLNGLNEGEGDTHMIQIPDYEFLTFECTITKSSGQIELFIPNSKYSVKINGVDRNFWIILRNVNQFPQDSYYFEAIHFQFIPDLVQHEFNEYIKKEFDVFSDAVVVSTSFPSTLNPSPTAPPAPPAPPMSDYINIGNNPTRPNAANDGDKLPLYDPNCEGCLQWECMIHTSTSQEQRKYLQQLESTESKWKKLFQSLGILDDPASEIPQAIEAIRSDMSDIQSKMEQLSSLSHISSSSAPSAPLPPAPATVPPPPPSMSSTQSCLEPIAEVSTTAPPAPPPPITEFINFSKEKNDSIPKQEENQEKSLPNFENWFQNQGNCGAEAKESPNSGIPSSSKNQVLETTPACPGKTTQPFYARWLQSQMNPAKISSSSTNQTLANTESPSNKESVEFPELQKCLTESETCETTPKIATSKQTTPTPSSSATSTKPKLSPAQKLSILQQHVMTLTQKQEFFEKVFSDTKFSDAILVNHALEEVPAFRCFLSHVSPVFQAIFESSIELPARIEVGPFKKETIKQVVQFSRGSEITVNGNEMDLFKFAKKFSIKILMDRCFAMMAHHLSVRNVCEYIQFAYEEENSELKKKCLEFLKDNKQIIDAYSMKQIPQHILLDAFLS